MLNNSPISGLTGFQRDLLIVIAGLDEPHGLGIKEELEDYYDTEIQDGRIYPNLDQLVEMGFLTKGRKDQRTNIYTITNAGEEAIKNRQGWEEEYAQEILMEQEKAVA